MADHNETDQEPRGHDHDACEDSPEGMTEHNPKAAARRRMIRALGGSGALGLATLAAGGWKKPVVDAVALPVHAAVSPAACEIGASVTVSNSNTSGATLGVCIELLDAGGTTSFGCYVASASGTASGGSSVTAGPGTYTLSYYWDTANTLTGVGLVNSGSVVCCNTSARGAISVNSTSSYEVLLTVSDTGECALGKVPP